MSKDTENTRLNTGAGQPPVKEEGPYSDAILVALTLGSSLGLLTSGIPLIIGPFPSGQGLYWNYFFYSVFVLVFLHLAAFTWSSVSRHIRGRGLSRNVPRYLEYGYAALISLGLAQVLFMSSQFADYITFTAGDDAELAARITRQASTHLVDDCPKGGKYFPADYCEKLHKIVDARVPNQYITSIVIYDQEFLRHSIRTDTVGTPEGVQYVDVLSPISRDADALRARREYGTSPQPATSSRAFSWIAIILLPVGIGLRVLKTSLELFGNLE